MREVEVIIPTDKIDIVESVLKEADIGFSKIEGKENTNLIIATFPENVEFIINELSKLGVGVAFGRIHVSSIDVVLPAPKPSEKTETRISTQELLSSVIQPSKPTRNYILFVVLSSVLATLGLIGNNAVVLIASMLIAPFLGPVLGISLGIVLLDKKLIKNGLTAIIVGFIISIIAGISFTVTNPNFTITQEIMLRVTPTIAELGLAVISGIALSVSIMSREISVIVGVAIAAALVPPAANIGIGFGSLNVEIITGSALLLLINVISILTIGSIIFWLKGIRPKESIRREKIAKRLVKRRVAALIIAFIAFATPLVYSSINVYQRASVEGRANTIAVNILENDYPDAFLISVSSQYYTTDPLTHNPCIRLSLTVSTENPMYVASVPATVAAAVFSELGIETIVNLAVNIFARAP